MKKMKRLAAFLLAMVMMLAMAMPAMAAETETGRITITPPEGVASDAQITYKIYQVFKAAGNGTAISYRLNGNHNTVPDGFVKDSAGNITLERTGTPTELNDEEISAIKRYVVEADLVDTVTTTGSTPAQSKVLDNGYYYITTTTGSVVTITSTNPNAAVDDKNTVPTVDKKITGASDITDEGKKALAQIGTDVTYTAKITVGKGSKNLVFHDTMDTGLTFKGNNSVTVTANPEITAANWYTIKDTPDGSDTLTISFADGIDEGTEITITYVATINKNALTKVVNDAYLSYGDSYTTTHSQTEVYNAEINVVKNDGHNTDDAGDDTPLQGAGFKLKNSESKFYKLVENKVTWVEDEANGDLHSSDESGNVPAFTGLANGTYTLVETVVPAGYNSAGEQTITIVSGDYTTGNLSQSKTVVNNTGLVLPTTGGMGTTIFYILGGILVIGAGVLFVTRKRMDGVK